MKRTIPAFALLASTVVGQDVVVPSSHAQMEGLRSLVFPLSEPGHWQMVIDRSHVGSFQSLTRITEVWLRRSVHALAYMNRLRGGAVHLEISASTTATDPLHLSPVFLDNRGANHRTIFSGDLTLQDPGPPPPAPAPWVAPHAVCIRLQAPIVDNGGNLCLEFVATAAAGQPLNSFWPIDCAHFGYAATAQDFGVRCGTASQSVAAERLRPGASASFALRSAPGTPCLHVLGTSNTSFLGAPLPIDLTPAGAPGCFLYNDWLSVTARATDARPQQPFGLAFVTLPLPFDQSLLGATLYSQWIALDPTANALGIVTTQGVHATLEAALPSHRIGLLANNDPAALDGEAMSHLCPVLRLFAPGR